MGQFDDKVGIITGAGGGIGQAYAEALAREGLAWLDDGARYARVQSRFEQIHQMLRCDTAQKAVDAIAQIIAA